MYSVMWSEHCSYKSSRIHLRRLPSEGEDVLVGPGENAGVVDVGDGVAVAVRIESHNHPSAIEPYEGAATGVGGILRDVFTMGARPIALMDPLFLGPLSDPRSRFIFDGVVRGISGYGNAVGVPTVGGQLTFSSSYEGNPLVNVFCLGLLPIERLVLAKASGEGNLVVLLGALTGRDGIGGVSVLASAGFAAEAQPGDEMREAGQSPPAGDLSRPGLTDESKRPSVQVGDPFEEKRLIDACLDLLDRRLVVGIQDLGGAGLTCAAAEVAARGGVGIDLDVAAVPLREEGMTPGEIMTSESQERMLAIVEPAVLDLVIERCRRHEVRAAVVGTVTSPGEDGVGMLVVRNGPAGKGAVVADVPARSLADEAPLYRRPLAAPARPAPSPPVEAQSADASADLLALLYDPSFVYRQYDHQLFLNTVRGPGEADAAVLKLAAPGIAWNGKGLALTCDANPTWCAIDPRAGTALTVAEAMLNIACAGAAPIAVVDCLNFGNPEHGEVMWQLSEAVDGLAEACRRFGVPVVGGNVSLYNESAGRDIDPTPVVGLVGLIEVMRTPPPGIWLNEGDDLVLVGPALDGSSSSAAIGGSRWAATLHGAFGGPLPPLDPERHRRVCEVTRRLVAATAAGLPSVAISGVHDVSDGGLALCLAELCCASARGATTSPGAVGSVAGLFSEAPSRLVVCTPDAQSVVAAYMAAGIPAAVVGRAGGDRLVVPGLVDLSLEELATARSRQPAEAAATALR
jgi:phosphoribosylformylglycinamidine synthase II